MDYIIIGSVAFLASMLTFFSGFGLGTLLLPAFLFFFPESVAVALTGVVHLLNNLFKMALVGKQANWKAVLKFGLPAILAAIGGALLLTGDKGNTIIYTYSLGDKTHEITYVKLTLSFLILLFVVLEYLPLLSKLKISEKHMPIGGAISGFFGGLSGHQGALRSAFLIKYRMPKEAFIATGIIIASVIDISRIGVYASRIEDIDFMENLPILSTAVLSAFTGAFLGRKLLKKVTLKFVQIAVSFMLTVIAILMGAGVI